MLTLFHEGIEEVLGLLGFEWFVLVDEHGLEDGLIKSEEVLGAATQSGVLLLLTSWLLSRYWSIVANLVLSVWMLKQRSLR